LTAKTPKVLNQENIAPESKAIVSKENAAPAKSLTQIEKEIVEARRKELKTTPVDDLKRLSEAQGLECGKKEEMVERLVKHEVAGRAAARAQQERIRQVLTNRKDELEALSAPELKERCSEEGIKGAQQLTKQGRIEALIKVWQDDDGVDQALAKLALDTREQELVSMDAATLQKRCEKVGVDPFVQEVMVDRIVAREHQAGRFGRPTLVWEVKESPAQVPAAGDMVEALMANEANRKRERELKKQEEEAVAKKRADMKTKSVDELKKLLAGKGRDTSGKKDDLVELLIQVGVEDEAAAKRKIELKAMEPGEIKKMLQRKALDANGKKDDMINALLAYEATVCRAAVAYNDKVEAVISESGAEWEKLSLAELKELCSSKNLAPGATKEACRERLGEALKASGEIDRILASRARAARRQELRNQSKEEVLKVCAALTLSPLVKEVMVERLLVHEEEFGCAQEPAAKRARKTK